MTTLRKVAHQALAALERVQPQVRGAIPIGDVEDAIAALRDALAQQEQAEPAGWLTSPRGVFRENPSWKLDAPQSVWWRIPLYAAAVVNQQLTTERQRQPLGNDYIAAAWRNSCECNPNAPTPVLIEHFARHIERAHGVRRDKTKEESL